VDQVMDPAVLRWRLLLLAGEDHIRMVEALWEFGWPDAPVPGAPPQEAVRATLRALVAEGLVTLLWSHEDDQATAPIPADQQLAAFDDPAVWDPPEDADWVVRFTTTAAGDEALRHRPPGVPPSNG
jgi:hypothetical protein